MRSVAHVLRTRHCSGVVIVASRKTGTVNLVVSRKSGGAVRAPGNAGDKRVKRKRGSRSAAAVAAQIERGYLKRTRTAGGTACVQSNHVDSRGTGTDGSGRPAVERTSTAARDGGDDTHSHKKERLAQQVHPRVRTGVVDTRVIGKPDQFDGDPMKHADWSFKLISFLGAVDQRYQQELTTTETSSTPRLNATQHTNVLHSGDDNCRSRVGQVSQCRRKRGGFEAWIQFVMEWEPKLRTRYAGLLMNVLGYRFRDDIPIKLAAFERTVHDYENQSGKTLLGMEDMRVKEHLIQKASEPQAGIRCERRFSKSRQHNSASTVNRCQCSAERIRRAKAKAKARTSRARTSPRMLRTNRPRKQRATIREVLLLPKDRPREGRVQKSD